MCSSCWKSMFRLLQTQNKPMEKNAESERIDDRYAPIFSMHLFRTDWFPKKGQSAGIVLLQKIQRVLAVQFLIFFVKPVGGNGL